MRMRLALVLALLSSAASAQSGVAVKQSGNVTPNQVPWWISSGVIGGGVTSADSPISSFGVTNNGFNGICTNSQRITAAGRQTLCMGVTDTGGGRITLQNYGTDTAQPLLLCANGTCVTPGGTISQLQVGVTTIGGGSFNDTFYNKAGVLGGFPFVVYANLVCDGATDNLAALNAAITTAAAIPASGVRGGKVLIPAASNFCNYSGTLNLNTQVAITIEGIAGFTGGVTTKSPLIYTGSGARAIDARDSNGVALKNLYLGYNNPAFAGILVDGGGNTPAPGGSVSSKLVLNNVSLSPIGAATASPLAKLLNLDQSIGADIGNVAFYAGKPSLQGAGIAAGSTTTAHIHDSQFKGHIGYAVNGCGESWTFDNDTWEPDSNGRQNAFANSISCKSLVFNNPWMSDTTVGGGIAISFLGDGLTIDGGTIAGTGAGDEAIAIVGNSSGISLKGGAVLQSFAVGIDFNSFTVTGVNVAQTKLNSITTKLANTSGVTGIITEGNTPSISQATAGQAYLGQSAADAAWKTISGDATLAASGALTLATVNANVGTFGSATQVPQYTVNGKGLITAAGNITIPTMTATVGGLVPTPPNNTTTFLRGDGTFAAVVGADVALTSTHIFVGNVSNVAVDVALSGDATMANTGALTLASVATAGTTGSSTAIPVITIDVKGRTTSITTAAVIAPAGTLTGATLAAGVTASSLTSLGTITSLTATTINAFTLGGTIAGGGNQLNNIIIGTTTPLAGLFTTLSASTSVTSPLHYGGFAVGSTATVNGTSNGSPASAFLLLQTNGQNTGFGQSTPLYKVHIGAGADTSSNAVTPSLYVTEAGATSFSVRDSTNDIEFGMFTVVSPAIVALGTRTNHPMWIQTNAANVAAWQTSGGLSIGSTSNDPGAGGLWATGAVVRFPAIAADTATADSTVCWKSSDGTLLKGTGALGICLGTSGAQFKTAFAPMAGGVDEIARLNFQNYRYRDGFGDSGARVQYGITAQDVETVLPDLVRHDASGMAINFDSGALLFIGLRAIQQLKSDNDNFEIRLAKLENRK